MHIREGSSRGSIMDWNMKEASWDLAELNEATGLPSTEETINGSGRFGSCERSNRRGFSVDLKLGQVGNSSSNNNEPAAAVVVTNKWKDVVGGVSKVMMTPSSSSGSSKRARAINSGNQTVSCLVDGCNSDLSNCRDYHRRHKVCELHSKTPVVTIGGHKQRFCQQCSRFHSLEEFDEGKRSCRKRLDGHNRRRRKPQVADGVGGRCGSFLSSYRQGTHHLLPFSSSHMYHPTAAMAHPAWNTDVRLHHDHLVDHKQDLFLGTSSSSSSSYTEANNNNKQQQLAFLQGDRSSTVTMENNQSRNRQALAIPSPPASVCQTFLRATPSLPAASLQVGGDRHHDSHCALSLLSSSQTHTSGSGLSQMVQPHHHHQEAMSIMQQQHHHHHQPLGLSLHDHGLETVDPVLVHHGSDHSPTTMYNMNEAPPFPFHWD